MIHVSEWYVFSKEGSSLRQRTLYSDDCNRLQQTATDCNRLQQTATDCNRKKAHLCVKEHCMPIIKSRGPTLPPTTKPLPCVQSLYLHIYLSMHLSIYVSLYLCAYVSTYVFTRLCIYVCIHASIYLSICIYIYIILSTH